MWLLNLLFLTSLLATGPADGQYQHHNRNRLKRMPTYDLENGGGNVGGLGNGADPEPGTGGGGGSNRWCNSESGSGNRPIPQIQLGKHGNAKQHTSGIAIQVAKEAKKANEDMAPAVKAAADKIKTEYADKATAAANAADAVLCGKAQLLEQLENEVRTAKTVLQQEIQKLGTYDENAQLAAKGHGQWQRQMKLLNGGLKGAKEKLCTAEQVSGVWEKSVVEGCAVLEAAQKRMTMLMPIRNEVHLDREKTLKAANNAAKAAQEAKDRVDQTEKNDPNFSDSSDRGRQRRAWQYTKMF